MQRIIGHIPLEIIFSDPGEGDIMPVENYQEGFRLENLQRNVYLQYQLKYSDPVNPFNSYVALSKHYSPTVYFTIANTLVEGLVQEGNKFHISLALEGAGENLARGWDIVKDILIQNQVIHFKVISPKWSYKTRRRARRCGKEITIYAFQEPNRSKSDWERILTQITQILAENNILPGPLAPEEKAIPGSNYISFRDDRLEIDRNDTPSNENMDEDSDDEREVDALNAPIDSRLAIHGSETQQKSSKTPPSVESQYHIDELSDIGTYVEASGISGESSEESKSSKTEVTNIFENLSVTIPFIQIPRPKFTKPPKIELPIDFFKDPKEPDSPGPDIDQLITPSPIILGLLNNDRHSTREDVSVPPDVIDEKQPPIQIDVFDSGLDSSIIPTITNPRDTQQTSHTVSETKNEVKSSSPSGFFSRLKSKPKANDDQYNNPDNNLIESTNCFQCIIL